jgi:hypothetical protein
MPGRDAGSTKSKKPVDQVTELRDLVVGYAKQETIDPIRSLKRYLALGAGGAVAIGVGSVYLILGLLRGLQELDWFNSRTQTDGWHGSWLIYVITLLAAIGLLALVGMLALRSKRRKGTTR